MASVNLINVHKSFGGDAHVVKGVNISINDGDFLVIVGPSGCGKSTTLNMIAGLEAVTSGEIYIGDRLVNDVEPKDRNISMVFQNHTLYPHLSVYDNLAFYLKSKHIKKDIIADKVLKIAKMLGIEDLLKRKPQQLSGGQQQRVAIGRAIIREPAVFLMDEPLSNLDVNLRGNMREEIKRLHKQLNATFVYVTHDQTEAMTLATYLVVMNDGVVQQIGTPFDVFMKPQNTFVAKFMGAHPINLFHCNVVNSGDRVFIDILGFKISAICKDQSIISDLRIDVGIRPEGFDIDKEGNGICLKVTYSEILGKLHLAIVGVSSPSALRRDGSAYTRRSAWRRSCGRPSRHSGKSLLASHRLAR